MATPGQKPVPVSPTPLAYERPGAEAIPGAHRSGKYLVVRSNANISRFCFCCGRPGAGAPLVKHLWSGRNGPHGSASHSGSSGSGIFAIIELVLLLIGLVIFLAWFFSEWSRSRGRTIMFGLCPEHRRRRRQWIAAAWLSMGVGTGLTAFGIAGMDHRYGPALYSSIASFAIGLLMEFAAIVFAATVPGPSLFRETGGEMWLKGAGTPLLDAQKELPATPIR